MNLVMGAALLLASFIGGDSASPSSEEIVEVLAEPEAPAPVVLTPRAYLFSTYPSLARRFDCVIGRESRWDPSAQNPRSGAAGLTQILLSTWMATPPGRRGESRFNAFSNIDGAAWLVSSGGGWRHWAATVGGC